MCERHKNTSLSAAILCLTVCVCNVLNKAYMFGRNVGPRLYQAYSHSRVGLDIRQEYTLAKKIALKRNTNNIKAK